MKKWQYLAGAMLVLLAAVTIGIALKSCELTESEKLKQTIQKNEADIDSLEKVRKINNSATVPFSDAKRDSVVRAVNAKNGFRLRVNRGNNVRN